MKFFNKSITLTLILFTFSIIYGKNVKEISNAEENSFITIGQWGSSSMTRGGQLIITPEGQIYRTSYEEIPLKKESIHKFLLEKMDSNGRELWSRSFYDRFRSRIKFSAVHSNEAIYLVDGRYLKKVSSSGDEEWKKYLGYPPSHKKLLEIDSQGDVYLAEDFLSKPKNYNKSGRLYIKLRKYSETGEMLWSRKFYTSKADVLDAVETDEKGNVYLLWHTKGYFEGLENQGEFDIVVTKINSAGDILWNKGWGTSDTDFGSQIAVDKSGSVYVAGETDLTSDELKIRGWLKKSENFLLKLSPNGKLLMEKKWQIADQDNIWKMLIDKAGNVYMAGDFKPFISQMIGVGGGSDMYLTKWNPEGEQLWIKKWGTHQSESVSSMIMDKDGNIILSGSTCGLHACDPFTIKTTTTLTE